MTPSPSTLAGPKAGWLLLAGLILIFAPSQIWLGEPIWHRDAGAVAQAIALAAAYGIGCALLPRFARSGSRPLVAVASAAAVPLAAFYLGVLILSPAYSRGVLLVGSVLFGVLLGAPLVVGRGTRPLVGALGGVLAIVLALGLRATPPEPTPRGLPVDTLFTHHGRLAGSHLTTDPNDTIPGGGLAHIGDDMLLVTGAGDFYRVDLANGDFEIEQLSLHAPLNRDDFVSANDSTVDGWRFRVAGILAQPAGDSVRLLVSHHFWKATEACFVLRLSDTTVPSDIGGDGGAAAPWRTIFETSPCLRIKDRGDPFAGQESGGRIAALGDSALLLSVGDHQFDGVNARTILAQGTENHYGKTILIPESGPARTFTRGHRNPQGLIVTATGDIWLTEHGPRGGDELNRLVDGANYGWPLRTMGTEYGGLTWPLSDPARANDDFAEAEFVWVPSVGVSNLIEIETDAVPGWKGDFLVAALATGSLYRLHREGGRIVYSEQIPAGWRVRDLAEAPDGRLVLWFDGGHLSAFTPVDAEHSGPESSARPPSPTG